MTERSVTNQRSLPNQCARQAKLSSRTTNEGPCARVGAPVQRDEAKASLRFTPRWSSTSSTTRPSFGSASEMAQTPPSPSQDFGGGDPSHLTPGPLCLQPTPPDGLVRLSHQLQVRCFLLVPRFLQSHSGAPCGSSPRSPIPLEKKHQRRVDGQLGSLPQG